MSSTEPVRDASVSVPNVIGLDWNVAKTRVEQAGLQAQASGGNTSGTVVTENPPSGRQVAVGSSVMLTLSGR